MRYYCVSDVHGYYDCLIDALDKAGFYTDDKPHKLVVCGDLLDRGSQANKVIEFMLQLQSEDKLIYISGNHEDLLLECMYDICIGNLLYVVGRHSHHMHNGTFDTLLQISNMTIYEALESPDELISRVRSSDYYKNLLPLCLDYYETPGYILTHGWIPCISIDNIRGKVYEYNEQWREADSDSWNMARWLNGMDMACNYHIVEQGKTIICGHWNASYGHDVFEKKCTQWGPDADHSAYFADGIIALDASTAVSGMVNCVVIED